MPWDLGCRKVQSRVIKMIEQDKPLFIIGSPPCTVFSNLQNLSRDKRDAAIVYEELRVGRAHLEFCARLYETQVKGGRFFVHEHPASAKSWAEPSMVRVAALPGVGAATVDMCMYGLRVKDGDTEGLARKSTRLMSNSHEVIKRMESRCVNLDPATSSIDRHVHIPLVSGRARQCQVYPRA